MALPHLVNTEAGRNKYDPVHSSIFEVRFTLPEPIRGLYAKDELLLSEHVLTVKGLDNLYKAPEVGEQKAYGTSRSYIKPVLDGTHADIEMTFSLNLRNAVDNYVLNVFRSWAMLGYDIDTGTRALKQDYCADWMTVVEANRQGDIYNEVIFKDVMINGPITGMDDLDYTKADPRELTVKFRSDWWKPTTIGYNKSL